MMEKETDSKKLGEIDIWKKLTFSCLAQSNDNSVQVFAAYGKSGLTIVICNEGDSPISVDLTWKNFTSSNTN
jgi:hypothetical protein